MRLLSYNILDGGKGREDAIVQVIASQKPDVVALVEAGDADVVEHIGRHLEMDVLHAPGNMHASALLTRWPVRESINHAPLHPELEKSFLEAKLIGLDGAELIVGVVHLHARALVADEARRLKELGIILSAFAPLRAARTPHLICGDFNANAPHRPIDPALCKPRTREEWEANGGRIPRWVVQKMLDDGYRDTLFELDAPSAETVGSFSTEFPGQRVDYFFSYLFPRRRLRSAWVERGPWARRASDHFPVGLEIAD
jgi:endonuclease/exonuclease/phosphatase family metal-dependent hydrolase